MEFHPAANLFPLMEGDPFDELVEDIRENGLLDPIVMLDDKILDGRNRWRACERIGVEPRVVEYAESLHPVEYVRSQNLHRRHLTPGQKAAIGASAEDMLEAEREKARERQVTSTGGPDPQLRQSIAEADTGRADERVAEAFGTNRESLRQARNLKDADEELFGQVKSGTITLPEAGRRATVQEAVRTLPEDEVERAQAITDRLMQDGTSSAIVAKLANRLTDMPQEERLRIYTLAESGDKMDWSRAQTDLAGTPPMPHPALGHIRSALDSLAKARRQLEGEASDMINGLSRTLRRIEANLKGEA